MVLSSSPHTAPPGARPGPSAMLSQQAASYRWTVYGLLALSLVLLAYPALRIGFDFEIDNNEGWDAYYQVRAMAGLSLYNTGAPLFMNDYPPLSFYIVGGLAKLVGDPVVAGRIISVLSVIVCAFAVASVVRTAGGSRLDATLAWATGIALFASFGTDYVGINDPQFLGQSMFLVCLAVYVRMRATAANGIVLALMISVAVLTKHNMLAIPLLISVDILLRWPARAKAAYLLTGFAMAGLSAAFFLLVVGEAFFHQGGLYDPARGFLMTIDMLSRLQAPLAAVGLVLLLARKERFYGLTLAYLALGLVLGALLMGGANDDINHSFEAFSALAIGAGLALHWLGRRTSMPAAKAAMALLINAGVLFYAPLALGRFAVDITGEMAKRERLFQDDVAYLKSVPGKALCQSFLLCFRAGQPMFFDPHNVRMAIARGNLPPDLLTGMLERHEIAVMQVEDKREHGPDEYPGKQAMPAFFIHFSDSVFDVLERDYKVARIGHMGRFFVPKSPP
jgi:hypothetical protein